MIKNSIFLDKDVNLNSIINKKIGVIGYGNQGRAQCLNLIDTELDVVVGIRKQSESIKELKLKSIKYDTITNVVKQSDVISLLIPDSCMNEVYDKYIYKNLKKGLTLIFSHGYNIHYNLLNITSFARSI